MNMIRIALCLFLSIVCSKAASFVQASYSTPQSPMLSVQVQSSEAQTSGDTNVLIVGWNDSVTSVTSVTDTAGNTYALAVGPTVWPGVGSQSIYYASNINASASNTVTVTFSGAAQYVDLRLAEYSGLSNVDAVGSSTGLGTSSSC